jgi:hypothetical protein
MSIAKDINELLDNILDIKAEIRRIDLEITPEQTLKNVQTGKKVNKEEVLEFVQGQITEIKNDLNKITNNGKNVKDVFTNKYYVNDSMQDREIIAKEKNPNKKRAQKDKPSKERQRREKANKHKPNKMTHEEWRQAIKNYKKGNKEQIKKMWKKYKNKNDDFYNDNDLPF